MTRSASVLGVLGWCWVGFYWPTQSHAPESVALRVCVLGVLGLRARARTRCFQLLKTDDAVSLYANPEKPNTPNTLNTDYSNPLIPLGFECVGFVLGWLYVCWVMILEGSR